MSHLIEMLNGAGAVSSRSGRVARNGGTPLSTNSASSVGSASRVAEESWATSRHCRRA